MICSHHLAIFTLHYTKNFVINRYCLDPFGTHKKKTQKGLIVIQQHMKDELFKLKKDSHIGQKICRNCIKRVKTSLENPDSETDKVYTPDTALHGNGSVLELNRSLSNITSPIKLDKVIKLTKRRRINYIDAKAEKVRDGFRAVMSEAIGVEPLSSCDTSDDFEDMIQDLKVKMKVSSRRDQVRLLTLIPPRWPREKVALDFGVSERQVREARDLRERGGILAEVPNSKKGNKALCDDVINRVTQFYKESEFVRIMPGAKQVVANRLPDGSKVYEPQRLILCDLTELYNHFCKEYPAMANQIKKSKFCELRPKYCKTVSSSGTHAVCVCTIHQNFRFLIEKIPSVNHYKEVIQEMVCNQNNSACMLRKCDRCPGREAVERMLTNLFDENEYDSDDRLTYSQWTTTDRSTIVTHSNTVTEFVELVSQKVDELTTHHYIKEEQSRFLKDLKENLPENEIIVQMDFAENYAFIVQDASQSFHWNNLQATLHPIVIYYMSNKQQQPQNNTLAHISYVFISDYMAHSHLAVYTMLRDLIPRLLRILPRPVTMIHYFTDGCAGQYKSFKAFANLMCHQEDFGMPAKWHYFATSHGKSACDGVGAVVKYQARRASLQRTTANLLTNVEDLYMFA